MIYTVECNFNNPSEETRWNNFYSSDKLPALISVPGFLTSQRFKAQTYNCPSYLAIHTITRVDVLTSIDYREKGGGNFARWQHFITEWHRNVYEGIEMAPNVVEKEYLLLCSSSPDQLQQLKLTPFALNAVALDRFPEFRWLATIDGIEIGNIIRALPKEVHLYEPLGMQLVSNYHC